MSAEHDEVLYVAELDDGDGFYLDDGPIVSGGGTAASI